MNKKPIPPLMEFFKEVEDPRIERNKAYPLIEVIIITVLAVIAGAEGWEDIEEYGDAKRDWLSKYLALKNGIPRHDVFRRVFVRLDPRQIEACFMAWVRAIKQEVNREVIAIDGKTARGSFNARQDIKAVHLLCAWATENRLVLGQVKTDDKSNEITAIPQLLQMIALKGAIVTIDAMGCQYAIADQIVASKADYVLGLKENQKTLHDDVKEYFADLDFSHPEGNLALQARRNVPESVVACHTTFDIDHGRSERRYYGTTSDVQWLVERHPSWKSIKSIAVVEAHRSIGEKTTVERRYYLSSLPADPALLAMAVRAHWGIENSLHHVLDVAFREDACRIKNGNAPVNMAFLRKIALTLARSDIKETVSIRKRLKRFAWSDPYLEHCLFHSVFASD